MRDVEGPARAVNVASFVGLGQWNCKQNYEQIDLQHINIINPVADDQHDNIMRLVSFIGVSLHVFSVIPLSCPFRLYCWHQQLFFYNRWISRRAIRRSSSKYKETKAWKRENKSSMIRNSIRPSITTLFITPLCRDILPTSKTKIRPCTGTQTGISSAI